MWRNEFDYYGNKENDIPLNMTCEDEHKILNEEEILTISRCFKLSDVQELKIPGKCYTLINADDLSRCINLRELDLSENLLSELPRNLNLSNLRLLDIVGNPFVHKPLIEQFPNLLILNIDPYIKLNMDSEAISYFCPNLKILNYEFFNEIVSDRFSNYVSKISKNIESLIRSKWESEFAGRFTNISDQIQRRIIVNEMVRQLQDRNSLNDEYLKNYRDLLINKLTEEYLKSKILETDDELLAGETSPYKKFNENCNSNADHDKKDQLLLNRFIDTYGEEMEELQKFIDELTGKNLENMSSHIVLTTTDVDGQPKQFLVEQPFSGFHIGQSLSQHKSVVKTIFNPKLIRGRPTAEFLPGELRNKDYVKGDMASDIYQKTVKASLGQRGLPKSNALSNFNGVANPNFKKRGRPPKRPGDISKNDIIETSNIGNKVPPRPRIRRRNGELRSLKDLNKTMGSSDSNLDYDPLHFIRCHGKDTSPHDQETKVWRCAFEPDQNNPGATTHIVATCGGEMVCLIDCEVGKVTNRFKREGEEFMALAWTTLEAEPDQKINILAAGGKSKEIRLFFRFSDYYCDMKGHSEDVSALAFNSNLPQILFSGDAKASVFIWDIGSPTTNKSKLLRYQLLMRLRCPRQDLNPVMNLVFLDHYQYLVAGCDDAMFAWKIQDFRCEKREREPDMELKLTEPNKLDIPLDCISYDGLALLGKTALVFRVVDNPSLLVFDFGTTLERRKGLQKTVPIEICGKLDWCKTNEYYININARSNLGAVLSGDSNGNISIYDLDPYIEDNPEKVSRGFNCPKFKVLEWPDCGSGESAEESLGYPNNAHPVINTVDMSSDGQFVVGVTDNNLVCIWKLTTI